MRVYKTLYFVHMYMYENFKTLNYADKFQATFGVLTIFELLFIKVSWIESYTIADTPLMYKKNVLFVQYQVIV